MIKCGNRKQHGNFNTYHVSAADVKACFAGRIVDSTSQNIDLAAREAAEYAAQAPVVEAAPVAAKTARKPTANEASALERMRKSAGTTDEERAYWKRLWAEDETVADGPLDEGNWSEQVPAATKAEDPKPALQHFFGRRGDATEKQVSFIRRLLAERVLDQLPLGWIVELDDRLDHDDLGKKDASIAIGKLLEQPKVVAKATVNTESSTRLDQPMPGAVPADPQATEDGIYRNPTTGEIWKLYITVHGAGVLCAKRATMTFALLGEETVQETTRIPLEKTATDAMSWHRVSFEYKGAAAKHDIKAAWRLTEDEAKRFGAIYGCCVRCHRTLTREDSIERMMGQVCYSKMGF
jgi:hypothetical protein